MGDHVVEDHVAKDHVVKDRVVEDHVAKYHVVEDHVIEDHVVEDHVAKDDCIVIILSSLLWSYSTHSEKFMLDFNMPLAQNNQYAEV